MPSLDDCIENKQMSGYSTFTREDALAELSLKLEAFIAALTRQISRKRLANPRHGFYIFPGLKIEQPALQILRAGSIP